MFEPICKTCGDSYTLRPECEDTGYCDLCAQTMLEDLLRDQKRLDYLDGAGRGCVRGTSFPKWEIQGNREDGLRGDDMTIREAIDWALRGGKIDQ